MEQNVLNFKNWILEQKSDQYSVKDEDNKIFLFATYAEACIRFHEMGIVEFQITRKTDQEVIFYLHFQLNDETHAKYLFEQLQDCLINTGPIIKKRILLSCSSALTTSFFAQKLNQTAELLNLHYEFHAVSFNYLPEVGANYDTILLAPQIAFKKKEFQNAFGKKPILEIPGKLFGSYDVMGIIELINQNFSVSDNMTPTEKSYILSSIRKIMAITTRIDSQFKISYRIYHHNKIIRSETIIKDRIDYHDFEDILNTVSVYEKDIDTVVISVPGVVHKGNVKLDNSNFNELNMKERLSERYPYHFIITNNANSTALGLYHLQSDFKSVIYHSQLKIGERAGQGIVINGQVITGKNGVAGEVNYLLENKDNREISTPDKAAKAVANYIISDIAIVGPEAVYIRCELIHETKKVKEYIQKRIDEEYIPELFILDHATEYMFYGAQIMASERKRDD